MTLLSTEKKVTFKIEKKAERIKAVTSPVM
jgi:hypothetical protein